MLRRGAVPLERRYNPCAIRDVGRGLVPRRNSMRHPAGDKPRPYERSNPRCGKLTMCDVRRGARLPPDPDATPGRGQVPALRERLGVTTAAWCGTVGWGLVVRWIPIRRCGRGRAPALHDGVPGELFTRGRRFAPAGRLCRRSRRMPTRGSSMCVPRSPRPRQRGCESPMARSPGHLLFRRRRCGSCARW